MSRNLCLVVMLGAGRSTVDELLGDRLGRRVADTDDEIRGWTGQSIPELFMEHGEDGWRYLHPQRGGPCRDDRDGRREATQAARPAKSLGRARRRTALEHTCI